MTEDRRYWMRDRPTLPPRFLWYPHWVEMGFPLHTLGRYEPIEDEL